MRVENKELYVDSVQFHYSGKQDVLTGGFIQMLVGDVTGLLGRNGAGKTTFMKIIFGALTAQNAYIKVNGKKIRRAFLSKEVCYLSQERFLPTAFTVQKSIHFMLSDEQSITRIERDEIISPILKNKIADISVGELRYLEILLLTEQKATFILLDEPFSGLSPVLIERVKQIILSKISIKSFLISDHDYMNVLEICKKILLLENGSCRMIQKKEELELFYVPEGTFSDQKD